MADARPWPPEAQDSCGLRGRVHCLTLDPDPRFQKLLIAKKDTLQFNYVARDGQTYFCGDPQGPSQEYTEYLRGDAGKQLVLAICNIMGNRKVGSSPRRRSHFLAGCPFYVEDIPNEKQTSDCMHGE